MKADCKHLKFLKLWASRKLGGIVVEQLAWSLEGKLKRNGVHFSTLFQILSQGHSMYDYKKE